MPRSCIANRITGMGRKKKKHIFLYDIENQKKLEELRKLFPGLTYDEIFREHLKLPTTDEVLNERYKEIAKLLSGKYKDEKLMDLMLLFWVMLMKCAKGEYDIRKLLYNFNADISKQVYKKR